MSKEKILIVEDEIIIAIDIESRLKKLGYTVSAIVSTGEEAINKVASEHPDVVLMDINLKGNLNGIEATKEISTRFSTPIIYLTANADDDTFNKAKATEPLGYLLKPFKEREFKLTLEISLSRYRAEKKLKEHDKWLATVLKSIGDAVITSDCNGAVTFMNPVAEELTGWKQLDVFGKDAIEVFNINHELTCNLSDSPVIQAEFGVANLPKQPLLTTKTGVQIPINYSVASINDDLGNITGVVLVFQDVTERNRAQEELSRAHENLEIRVQERTIELATTNAELQVEITSRFSAESALRQAHEELELRVGKRTVELATANATLKAEISDRKAVEAALRQAHDELEMRVTERTKELADVNVALQAEITERKQAEAALRQSEERFQAFMNNSPVVAFMKDEDGRFIYINQPFERMFKTKMVDMQGKTDFDFTGEEVAKQVRENDAVVLSTGKTLEVIETVPTPDGCQHYWLVFKFVINEVGGRRLLGGVAVNITKQKLTESALQRQFHEKEVLLKEIHHRVKNNLQVIESLLRLQSRYIKDKHALTMFKESQNRIKAMAIIHEKLYQSKDLATINLSEYIRSLAASILRSYGTNANTKLQIDDNIYLGFDAAISCGLIINELVANSLKHAFSENQRGEIYICLQTSKEYNYTLAISDNGIGFPKDLDFRNTESLGLQLVCSLVEQLKATIELYSQNGTEFKIAFTDKNHKSTSPK